MYLHPGWEVRLLYCEYQARDTGPSVVVSHQRPGRLHALPGLPFAVKGAVDQTLTVLRNVATCSRLSGVVWEATSLRQWIQWWC